MQSENPNDIIRNEVAHARARERRLENRAQQDSSAGEEARQQLAAIQENRMLDAIAQKVLSRIQVSGHGGVKAQGANGVFVISLADQIGGPAQSDAVAGSSPIEFALYDASSGGSTAVGISMGVITPWNPPSGLQPWPKEFTAGNKYKAEFPVGGLGVAWLKATTTSLGAVVKYNVGVTNGTNPPTNTPTAGYLVLGVFTTESGGLQILSGQNGVGNQFYNWCSGNHMWGPA